MELHQTTVSNATIIYTIFQINVNNAQSKMVIILIMQLVYAYLVIQLANLALGQTQQNAYYVIQIFISIRDNVKSVIYLMGST